MSASATGEGWGYFWLAAVAAGALTSGGLWWLLAARRDRYSRRRGAWIGALAGLVGHPVCWYFNILASNICYWTTGGCVSSLQEPPVDLVVGLAAALALSIWSWLLFGLLTVPLGALGGSLLGRRYALSSPTIPPG